ncbi:hypothetical protein B0T25DRAFT_513940 [Lasiosphaeria hispida]|uniref:Uncharacterized protein n=1 Tax=Lasiosphaeria hispida TaxID=260671 RepID=A0AAJ0HWT9_9PEZI|nr:hypothetical protein B0T25DRAFT_513940 [Lasiosphaeria hispida]
MRHHWVHYTKSIQGQPVSHKTKRRHHWVHYTKSILGPSAARTSRGIVGCITPKAFKASPSGASMAVPSPTSAAGGHEGFVFKSMDSRTCFKAISNEWLQVTSK